MSAALDLRDMTVDIARRRVVSDVSLSVMPGEVVGVLGPNGCGKTTLIRAALGLVRAVGGEARLGGQAVASLDEAARARLAGYLPQERRVGWNLPAWRIAALGAPHQPPRHAREAALAALKAVGMEALAERGALDMSGGERARVLFARLLVTGAPLLAADEPAAGLDPDAQLLIMDILRRRAGAGAGVLVTLHDLSLAARSCDRLVVMAQGRVVASGSPREALSPAVLSQAFGLTGQMMETALGPVVVGAREAPRA